MDTQEFQQKLGCDVAAELCHNFLTKTKTVDEKKKKIDTRIGLKNNRDKSAPATAMTEMTRVNNDNNIAKRKFEQKKETSP